MSAVARAVETPEQQAEDWASFHLSSAQRARRRLEAMLRGSAEYGELNRVRHAALDEARKHLAKLHAVGYPVARDVLDLMAAEGL